MKNQKNQNSGKKTSINSVAAKRLRGRLLAQKALEMFEADQANPGASFDVTEYRKVLQMDGSEKNSPRCKATTPSGVLPLRLSI